MATLRVVILFMTRSVRSRFSGACCYARRPSDRRRNGHHRSVLRRRSGCAAPAAEVGSLGSLIASATAAKEGVATALPPKLGGLGSFVASATAIAVGAGTVAPPKG